jgi:hypothetical protein
MSFSSDIYVPSKHGTTLITNFYESDLTNKNYMDLFERYNKLLKVSSETVYYTDSLLQEIEKEYKVCMQDSFVSTDGWRVFVHELNEPITIELKDIPNGIENEYSLYGERIMCLDSIPDKYNSYIRKRDKIFVYSGNGLSKSLSMFKKKHPIHKLGDDILIYNSF